MNATERGEKRREQPGRGSRGSRLSLTTALATNSGAQLVGSAVSVVFGWLVFVAVTRALGPSSYGNLATANVLLFFVIQFADAGLSQSFLREIVRSPESAERSLGAALTLRVLVSSIFIALGLGAAFLLPLESEARLAMTIGSVGAMLTLLNLSLLPILQARLTTYWSVIATILGRAATLGLTLAFLAIGFGIAGVVWANVIGLGITLVGTAVAAHRVVRIRPRIDPAYCRSLLKGSLILGGAVVVGLVYFRVDLFLVALLRPSREVGLYGAAYKFVELSALVTNAFSTTFFPTLARFLETGDRRTRDLLQMSFDVSVAAGLPLCVASATLAPHLVALTAGSRFSDGATALRLLSPYFVLSFATTVFLYVLIAAHRERILLSVMGGILAINVTLNVVFIPIYGYKTAAVTSVASEFCALVLSAYLAARITGFRARLSYTGMLILSASAMAGVILAVPGPWPLVALLATVIYVAAVLALPGTCRELTRRLFVSARAAALGAPGR